MSGSPYPLCLTFFAELAALGVSDVVVSPGSRSTPLAVSAKASGLRCTIELDERVAAFHALGMAKVSGRPSVLVCSSGTAVANHLPAVVEARHAGVPLIVCSADRPPELRRWGAGQTIDQVGIFGSNPVWAWELPVGGELDDAHDADVGRVAALRAVTEATGRRPGPVHLNWPFREPLQPSGPVEAPTPRLSADAVERPRSAPSALLADLARRHERGLIVVGPAELDTATASEITGFATRAGWPVVADPASQLRRGPHVPGAPLIVGGELLFGTPAFVEQVGRAEVVVRVGLAPTSKQYRLWLEANRPERLVLVGPGVEWADPTGSVTDVVDAALPGCFADASPLSGQRTETAWCRLWTNADAATRRVVAEAAAGRDELAVASVVAATDRCATLVVSSSMPVRDIELVLHPADRPLHVVINRGANGIDGVLATALGAASAGDGPTVVFIGDVATVHDLGGLAAIGRHRPDLVVVLVDNDGGGIFSFLPVAALGDAVHFDELFHTPHGTDLVAVAAALGLTASAVDRSDLPEALDRALAAGGPHLLSVSTTASDTVARFAELRGSVAEALAGR